MTNIRRYDIDSLRVLAFIWLIFYHVGMFYVADWSWHVKSVRQSELLQWLMMWSSPWRMSLLFVISGISLALTTVRQRRSVLFKNRFWKIFVPLIFAMYFIVPPQLFIELKTKAAFTGNYWQFWLMYINPWTKAYSNYQGSPLGLLTWNHLWFLAYIWIYSMLLCMLTPVFRTLEAKLTQANSRSKSLALLLVLPICLLTISSIQLRPFYPTSFALVSDWYNHARYLVAFIAGYFMAKNMDFWLFLSKKLRWFFIMSLACFSFMVLMELDQLPMFFNSSSYFNATIESINTWGWICTLLGYSYRYFNKPNSAFKQLNKIVLPCYILHQSVIVLSAYYLSLLSLPIVLEVFLILFTTMLFCTIGVFVISKFVFLCRVFGMKKL